MCMDCKCGEPNNDHGRPDEHITLERLERAAMANHISTREVAERIGAEADRATQKGR